MVNLPPTCFLASGGQTRVDTGRCASEKCTVRNSGVLPGNAVCCGQVATEPIEAECDGFVYKTRKITACGCIECPEGDEVSIEGDVYVGASDEVVEYLELMVEGLGSTTSLRVNGGKFQTEDVPTGDAITIRYEPGTTEPYLGTVAVVHIVDGVQKYHVPIQLTLKPAPVVVDPTKGATIDVGGSPSTDPALQVTIPPDAIVDVDGNPVQGDVNVFVSFSDPRVEDGLSSAPGEFTYDDDEGETMQLQTFGVVGLHVETSDGQKAYISGQASFKVNVSSLGIPDPVDGEPGTSLWTLDPVSGNWKESTPLTGSTATKRKKRQTGNADTAFSIFPRNIPYINIDKPLLRGRQCYVSVFVYRNEKMTEGISGKRVRIYTKQLSGATYLGQSVAMTDLDGKACLPLACGLKHELIMHRRFRPVASNTHHLPGQFKHSSDSNRVRVEFVSPLIGDITDGSGPVHRYDMNTCPGSTQQDFHFQFYLTEPVPEPGRLDAVELRPNLSLSWYDGYHYEWYDSIWYTACAIGLNIVVSTTGLLILVTVTESENRPR